MQELRGAFGTLSAESMMYQKCFVELQKVGLNQLLPGNISERGRMEVSPHIFSILIPLEQLVHDLTESMYLYQQNLEDIGQILYLFDGGFYLDTKSSMNLAHSVFDLPLVCRRLFSSQYCIGSTSG